MAKLAILSFFVAAVNAFAIRDNYDVVTKYNCWNKGEVFLDRGLVFRFEESFLNSWPGNVAFDCQMPVTNRYKSPGIISIIQHLKFRKNGDNCIDHIKFSNDDRKRCGDIIMGQIFLNNGTPWNPPTFISEFAGPFLVGKGPNSNHLVSIGASVNPSSAVSTYIHVDGKPLQPDENLGFFISFTGFVECDGLNVPKGMFNCGYGVCILEMFVGDGIVNCPFGDCRDEGSCHEALKDFDILTDGKYSGGSIMENSTVAFPRIARPFLQWLLKNHPETGVSTGRIEHKVVQELENIKEDVKKNGGYLERIMQMLERNFTSQIKNMSGY